MKIGSGSREPTIKRLILEELTGELEPVESIRDRLARRGVPLSEDEDRDRLEIVLSDLVMDGLLGAYLLHADSPFLTAVDASSQSILNCWFIATERGSASLRNGVEGKN